jgi:glycosyltransferase involved in cell wall biosynthesis
MRNKKIWISWEKHRRTTELTKHLGVELFTLLPNDNYISKVIINTLKTIKLLIKHRPHMLFVQNPSLMLNFIVCIFKPLFGYKLVVDRHSNFKLETLNNKKIKYKLFHLISNYTIRKSDLIVVTNVFLKDLVEEKGGKAEVLQDALPVLEFANSDSYQLPAVKKKVTFICTFADDEPMEEVKKSCQLNYDVLFYITGKPKEKDREGWSDNVTLTGFLKEEEYQSLLQNSDVILVLTTKENLLLCGAYEAVSLNKPLVTSDQLALKEYFYKGALYSDNTGQGISDAVNQAFMDIEQLQLDMSEYNKEISVAWKCKFQKLSQILDNEPF